MASNTGMHSPTSFGSDPTIGNTTFVQADPSNFREVVQKLTGAPEEASAEKLPLTLPSSRVATLTHNKPTTTEMIGPKKKPNFKLQERRHAAKKLELSIGVSERPFFFNGSMSMSMTPSPSPSPSPSPILSPCWYVGKSNCNRGEMVMASPVSPLEVVARGSPRTPQEEEERAIAEKGFYLHPTTPRGSHPPQLLPLFPLHSPHT